MRAAPSAAFLVLVVLGCSGQLAAQNVRLNLDAGVSHARPPSGVEAEEASYLLGGARFMAGPLFGSLYGGLGPDSESGSWASGNLGTAFRLPITGGLELGLTTLGSAFVVGDPTPYRAATLRATPEVRAAVGAAYLAVRGHAGIGISEVSESSDPLAADVTTDLWAYGGGLEIGRRFGDLDLQAGIDGYGSEQGEYGAAYLGADVRGGGAVWRARLRLWDTPADVEAQLELSLSIPFGPSWSAELAGGRSGPDPLLDVPAAVNGSLVLSWRVLTPPRPPSPVYTVRERRGVVVFRLEGRSAAQSVSVAGDFSRWKPIPLEREGDVWLGRVDVAPGVYHFGFLVDGEWYVPDVAPGRVVDEYGRVNATLVVPAPVTGRTGESSDG